MKLYKNIEYANWMALVIPFLFAGGLAVINIQGIGGDGKLAYAIPGLILSLVFMAFIGYGMRLKRLSSKQ